MDIYHGNYEDTQIKEFSISFSRGIQPPSLFLIEKLGEHD